MELQLPEHQLQPGPCPSAAVGAGRAGESVSRKSAVSRWLPEPPDRQRSHLGDAVMVAIHVHDAEVVVQCGLRDEEIRDRRAVPHAVVMGQVTLEVQGTIEDVARRSSPTGQMNSDPASASSSRPTEGSEARAAALLSSTHPATSTCPLTSARPHRYEPATGSGTPAVGLHGWPLLPRRRQRHA